MNTILVIQCSDQVGLVSLVTSILAKKQINIVSLREYVDKKENRFYMRLEIFENDLENDSLIRENESLKNGYLTSKNDLENDFLSGETENPKNDYLAIENELRKVLPQDVSISINQDQQKKVIVLVTREYHCLADILIRNYFGTLNATVQCVIGNHKDLENICKRFDIPFFLVQHEQGKNREFELGLTDVINQFLPDYIVLAKFMRILSSEFVARFPSQLINIHHSFLPAFIGANPYRQAFDRGVKLLGATAHFVTNELDEGPIIAQQTISVNHSLTITDMVEVGKEIETAVLVKALKLVFEDRVLVYKNKTVVFEK